MSGHSYLIGSGSAVSHSGLRGRAGLFCGADEEEWRRASSLLMSTCPTFILFLLMWTLQTVFNFFSLPRYSHTQPLIDKRIFHFHTVLFLLLFPSNAWGLCHFSQSFIFSSLTSAFVQSWQRNNSYSWSQCGSVVSGLNSAKVKTKIFVSWRFLGFAHESWKHSVI